MCNWVGDVLCFATNGNCNVHLSGYLVEDEFEEDEELSEDEEMPTLVDYKRKRSSSEKGAQKKSRTELLLDEADDYDSEDDTTFNLQEAEEDEDDEEDVDLEDEESDDDDNDEEDDENVAENEDESSLSENEDDTATKIEVKRKPVSNLNGIAAKPNENQKKKKQKQEQKQKNVDKAIKAVTPNKTKTNTKNETPEPVKMPQKRSLEGGVLIQDLKQGTGAAVKSGNMVQVYYEGRLKQNNKMFDSNKQGAGFKFKVGKQEVIKGWDVGLIGMHVGGKRRITCPPQMAYGQKGSPPVIPPNSTLVFEVEVKNIM